MSKKPSAVPPDVNSQAMFVGAIAVSAHINESTAASELAELYEWTMKSLAAVTTIAILYVALVLVIGFVLKTRI